MATNLGIGCLIGADHLDPGAQRPPMRTPRLTQLDRADRPIIRQNRAFIDPMQTASGQYWPSSGTLWHAYKVKTHIELWLVFSEKYISQPYHLTKLENLHLRKYIYHQGNLAYMRGRIQWADILIDSHAGVQGLHKWGLNSSRPEKMAAAKLTTCIQMHYLEWKLLYIKSHCTAVYS